jgi:mRNA interferase RelE/StbE
MYDLRLARRAELGLRSVRSGDPRAYRRIVTSIRALADDPRPVGSTKLTAFDPPAWRIRVGDYRTVYEVDDNAVVIVVVNAAPRGEIYR